MGTSCQKGFVLPQPIISQPENLYLYIHPVIGPLHRWDMGGESGGPETEQDRGAGSTQNPNQV